MNLHLSVKEFLTDKRPVLTGRSAFCACAAAAATLSEGLTLGLIVLLMSVLGGFVYTLCSKLYEKELRPLICGAAAAGIATLAVLFLRAYLPDLGEEPELYVLIMAVGFFFPAKPNLSGTSCIAAALFDGFLCLLLILLTGALREFLSRALGLTVVSEPFGGFLAASCLTALLQTAVRKTEKTSVAEKSKEG